MGSRCSIVIEAESETQAAGAAGAAFEEIVRIEAVLSDYRPDSESMRLMQRQPHTWHPVSATLLEMLVESEDIHRKTGGAFDPTIGVYTHLWRSGTQPTPEELAAAATRMGMGHIEIDAEHARIRFDTAGMILDFGGVGKGYAAQRALELIRSKGFRVAQVDMGGDLALGDPPSDHPRGWRVKIVTGLGDARVEYLSNCAVATSGDLERFYEYRGVQYSHIVDPFTGLGMTERRAVTVIAPDATLADALASAASVVGRGGVDALGKAYPSASIEIVSRPVGGSE